MTEPTKNFYQIDIPRLPVIPGTDLPTTCREIRQGAEMTDNDLVHAEQDIQMREALFRNGVTAVDIEHARKRKFAIMMEQVMAEYHQPPVAPAWVAQLRQDLHQEMAQLRQEVNTLLDASLELVNSNNQTRNYRILTEPNNVHIPLFSYRNRNRSLGGPLPGRPQPAVPPVLPAFGAIIPSPPFPRDIHDADTFTMDQVEALSMVLNNDFGIVAQDSIEACRHKMKEYLFVTMR